MENVEALCAPWPGAVAVSGGSDSIALMVLLGEWARVMGKPAPVVLTVDHGLRGGSPRDAKKVVARAWAAGLEAHVLTWRARKKPSSDIEAAARDARYRLMGAWCRTNRLKSLYVAHSLEDQAETFLLRLARGSGIDGLSAMARVARFPSPGCDNLVLVRPLLDTPRGTLRRFLEVRKESWIEDSMNVDPRFARARLRAAWPTLESLGLTAARIALAAHHLARAKVALDKETEELLARSCRFDCTRAVIDGAAFSLESPEIGLRALAAILMRVAGQTYRPRFQRLEPLFDLIRGCGLETARTLHGCRIAPAPRRDAIFGSGTLIVAREPERKRPEREQKN